MPQEQQAVFLSTFARDASSTTGPGYPDGCWHCQCQNNGTVEAPLWHLLLLLPPVAEHGSLKAMQLRLPEQGCCRGGHMSGQTRVDWLAKSRAELHIVRVLAMSSMGSIWVLGPVCPYAMAIGAATHVQPARHCWRRNCNK